VKVLHVIARFNVGGTATYLYNLLDELENKGIETLLATGQVPSNEKEDLRVLKLRCFRVEKLSRAISPVNDFIAFRKINSIIREFKPDIIHSHTFKAGLLIRLRKQSTPIVHTFHGHHLYDPEFGRTSSSIFNLVERILAKRTSKFITIGKRVGQDLFAQGIGNSSQFISIPPGIKKLELLEPELIKEKFSIDKCAFVVVWLGRFTQVKRPDLVVEIAKKLPNLFFVMAGDGELRERISFGAPQNLRIVGVQSAAEMWSIANLALLTSDSEGMPLSIIEAQMSGVPVVATNVGSVSEIVEDGVTGILSEVDGDQITSKIVELLENRTKLEEMSKAAEARAGSLFTREAMVEKHLKVYQEVLGRVTK